PEPPPEAEANSVFIEQSKAVRKDEDIFCKEPNGFPATCSFDSTLTPRRVHSPAPVTHRHRARPFEFTLARGLAFLFQRVDTCARRIPLDGVDRQRTNFS
ncbi:hypothetical protein CCACVL1_21655, partial [Corchorus capsularis]